MHNQRLCLGIVVDLLPVDCISHGLTLVNAPPVPVCPDVPVFTLGFNLILNDPVPFEYWFLFLLPRSSLALFTCGFTSFIIGSGGGAVGAGGKGGGGAGGKGGGVGGAPPSAYTH